MGLIGPACTPGNGFSGRVLIGRGLTKPSNDTLQEHRRRDSHPLSGSQALPGPKPRESQPDTVAAAMAAGKRPDPFRTRKLSPPAPRVLPGRPGGRAGHRRTTRNQQGPTRHDRAGPCCVCTPPRDAAQLNQTTRAPPGSWSRSTGQDALPLLDREDYRRPAAFNAKYRSASAGANRSGTASTTSTPCRPSSAAT